MNNNALPFERAGRLLVLLSCWCLAILVCLSRTYLQYHTLSQVIVGSTIGAITGVSWFSLTHLVLTPLYPTIVSWYLYYYSNFYTTEKDECEIIDVRFFLIFRFLVCVAGKFPNIYCCVIQHLFQIFSGLSTR